MALIKIETSSTTLGNIIADVDTPLVLTAIAVDGFTMAITHPTLNTVRVNWQTNVADVATATLLAHSNVNVAIEASVADAYAIPVLSGITETDGTPHPLINYVLA